MYKGNGSVKSGNGEVRGKEKRGHKSKKLRSDISFKRRRYYLLQTKTPRGRCDNLYKIYNIIIRYVDINYIILLLTNYIDMNTDAHDYLQNTNF